MHLDLPTLFVVTVFVAFVMGVLLAHAGLQNREAPALVWWGCGSLAASVGAAGLALRGTLPGVLSIDFANAVLFVAHALVWTGARVFERRPPRPMWMMAGAWLWLSACQIPAFRASIDLRVILAAMIATAYASATALELWRGRQEPLPSRKPAVMLVAVHAAFFPVRIPLALIYPPATEEQLLQSAWIAALLFETILHTIAVAFLLLAMAKERLERKQAIAASTDPLTGIANRRAFFAEGARRLDADFLAGAPAALLLFDLDHFKRINDRFGHDAGDRTLIAFCEIARGQLGPDAIFGRLGGEEFVCLLPRTEARLAHLAAEHVRVAFAMAEIAAGGELVRGTVSVGMASTVACGHDLDELVAAADKALYRAKSQGRNRVETSGGAEDAHGAEGTHATERRDNRAA